MKKKSNLGLELSNDANKKYTLVKIFNFGQNDENSVAHQFL